MTELKPGQGYGAGFRCTPDSQWLVRMQKTGSGEQDLYLYHVEKGAFVSATKTSFSDLAWAYFHSRPDTGKMKLDYHISANLVKGTEGPIAAWRALAGQPLPRDLAVGRNGQASEERRREGVGRLALPL